MKLGGLIGAALAIGAALIGYEYYKENKASKKDLEQDFQDCEGDIDAEFKENADEEAGSFETKEANPNKKYTSLNANKDQFVAAAKNTLEAAKGMVEPVKEMAKDVFEIAKEKSGDAGVVVSDYYNDAKEVVGDIVDVAKDKLGEVSEDLASKAKAAKESFGDSVNFSDKDFSKEVEFTDDFDDFDDGPEDEIIIEPVHTSPVEEDNKQ